MKNRNCTIDLLRLVFAIGIVALHSSPFLEFSSMGSYVFSQTLSRLGVPFFASVSGYYFFKSKNHFRTIKKYSLIYFFWSGLMLTFSMFSWGSFSKSYLIYAINTLFLEGWHHLWYMLAMIYTFLVLCTLNHIHHRSYRIIYILSFVFLAIGIARSNYGNLFNDLPLFALLQHYDSNMQCTRLFLVIPFFMLGYALNKPIHERIMRNSLTLTLISITGLLAEILISTVFDFNADVTLCLFTYPTVFFLLVWALSNPYPQFHLLSCYASSMASAIYLGHYVLTIVFVEAGLSQTPVFFLSMIIPALLGIIVTKIDHPFINKFI